ncbi:hypothetical protein PRIPAC_97397, partial [Pristionchus pacificus]
QIRMSRNSGYYIILIVVFCLSSVSSRSTAEKAEKERHLEERLRQFTQRRREAFDYNDNNVGSVFSKCPKKCQSILGNGYCDKECAIDECFWDLGDCTTRRDCSDLQCPNDGLCRPLCEINSCVTPVCLPEHMNMRQMAVVVTPFVNTSHFLMHLPRTEYALETYTKQYGLTVVLESAKDGPLLFGHSGDYLMERVLYDETNKTMIKGGCRHKKGLIAVFSIRRPIDRLLTYNDHEYVRVMESLGLGMQKEKHLATVNLFTVPESVLEGFQGVYQYSYHYKDWHQKYRFEPAADFAAKYLEEHLLC